MRTSTCHASSLRDSQASVSATAELSKLSIRASGVSVRARLDVSVALAGGGVHGGLDASGCPRGEVGDGFGVLANVAHKMLERPSRELRGGGEGLFARAQSLEFGTE